MAAQRISSWEKRCLSKEVAQWRSGSTKNHPSVRWFTSSMLLWFIALNHWVIDSPFHSVIDSLIHLNSLVHSCIRSLSHRFTDLSLHCSIDPFQRFIYSLYFIYSFTASLIHWFIDPLSHSCIDSWVHSFTESSVHWLVVSLKHRFIASLTDWLTCCWTESRLVDS